MSSSRSLGSPRGIEGAPMTVAKVKDEKIRGGFNLFLMNSTLPYDLGLIQLPNTSISENSNADFSYWSSLLVVEAKLYVVGVGKTTIYDLHDQTYINASPLNVPKFFPVLISVGDRIVACERAFPLTLTGPHLYLYSWCESLDTNHVERGWSPLPKPCPNNFVDILKLQSPIDACASYDHSFYLSFGDMCTLSYNFLSNEWVSTRTPLPFLDQAKLVDDIYFGFSRQKPLVVSSFCLVDPLIGSFDTLASYELTEQPEDFLVPVTYAFVPVKGTPHLRLCVFRALNSCIELPGLYIKKSDVIVEMYRLLEDGKMELVWTKEYPKKFTDAQRIYSFFSS